MLKWFTYRVSEKQLTHKVSDVWESNSDKSFYHYIIKDFREPSRADFPHDVAKKGSSKQHSDEEDCNIRTSCWSKTVYLPVLINQTMNLF